MASSFETQRRIEFADTDMAGIVHFANFFRFMEAAEHEFVRTLGLRLHEEVDGRMVGFARVHAECDYKAPLHYQDLVTIQVRVVKKRASTLGYEFRFARAGEERAAAVGRLTVCCVTRSETGGSLRPCPLPPELDRRVEVAPVTESTVDGESAS